jgi:hypothetical protein
VKLPISLPPPPSIGVLFLDDEQVTEIDDWRHQMTDSATAEVPPPDDSPPITIQLCSALMARLA